MTNYNERLDEVLQNLSWKQHELGTKGLIPLSRHEYEAKQSITSLIKDLVAGAKPELPALFTELDDISVIMYKKGADEFERNLLKALEQL